MKVLMVGASGRYARYVLPALKRRGATVRALVRVEQANVPEGPFREGMRRMYANYGRYGFPGGNSLVLRTILDRTPRTLREFLAEQRRC